MKRLLSLIANAIGYTSFGLASLVVGERVTMACEEMLGVVCLKMVVDGRMENLVKLTWILFIDQANKIVICELKIRKKNINKNVKDAFYMF
jgi:hypothetical protein